MHEEKKNSCENCGKVFTMMYQLNNHKLKAHSDTPKSFFCNICKKSFHFRHDLNHHLKLSHNEKRFLQYTNTQPVNNIYQPTLVNRGAMQLVDVKWLMLNVYCLGFNWNWNWIGYIFFSQTDILTESKNRLMLLQATIG